MTDINQNTSTNPFTSDQIKGPLDRVVACVVVYTLAKLKLDSTLAPDIAVFVVMGLSGLYGWWVNRPQAVKQSAVAIPGTLVVDVKPGMSMALAAESLAEASSVDKVLAQVDTAGRAPSNKVQAA